MNNSMKFLVKEIDKGKRLDIFLSQQIENLTRTNIKKIIESNNVKINRKIIKSSSKKVRSNDLITIKLLIKDSVKLLPNKIELDVRFEDKDILIINKPKGMVVHPGAGNPTGTLVNGLLNFDSSLSYLPRAGIVHRLDKDTSGLMVVSRNEKTYLNLIDQLKERTVTRKYTALVVGEPSLSGVIDKPIGRHPKFRTKQAVVKSGKEAISRFKKVKSLEGYSLLEVSLETGRTHQIRVHLSYLGFPIVGDNTYGGRRKYVKGTSEKLRNKINQLKRQALHASSLSFIHPSTKKTLAFDCELPDDMKQLIRALKEND